MEDDSNGFVQDELNRRQKVRNDRAKRQAQEASEELDLDSSLRGGGWKEMHMSMAASSHSLSHLHSHKRVQHLLCLDSDMVSISLLFIECLHIVITH